MEMCLNLQVEMNVNSHEMINGWKKLNKCSFVDTVNDIYTFTTKDKVVKVSNQLTDMQVISCD